MVLLVALIVRGVAFEYRGKGLSPRWRRTWDVLLTVGSLLAPLLIGVALGDLLTGLPINASQEYTGSFFTLLQPYGLFTGVTLVALCVLHGATFLTLKTTGELRDRAGRLARRVAPVTFALVVGFAIWTHVTAGKGFLLNVVEVAAILAVLAAAWLVHERREGWAFTATTLAMATSVLSIFVELYPRVMVSSTSPAFSLTIHNTAVRLLCPDRDDDRAGYLPAVCTRLPGLDLLRLPAPDQRRHVPAAGARTGGRRASRPVSRPRGDSDRIGTQPGPVPAAARRAA